MFNLSLPKMLSNPQTATPNKAVPDSTGIEILSIMPL
jgi:hypothetical protein